MRRPTLSAGVLRETGDWQDGGSTGGAALVEGLRQGDAGALERLIREHGAGMLQVARRLTRSEQDARDAFALACADAVKDAAAFDPRSRLSTWVRRLALRAALETVAARPRSQSGTIESLLPAFDDTGRHAEPWTAVNPTPGREATDPATAAAAVDLLPDDYRSVFILCDVEGLCADDAAGLLGVTPADVARRLHRARMALVTLLRRAGQARPLRISTGA